MTCPPRRTALVATATLLLLGGCGLKGPLALPEKAERVIIRGPQAGTTCSGPAGAGRRGAARTRHGLGTEVLDGGGTPAAAPAPARR